MIIVAPEAKASKFMQVRKEATFACIEEKVKFVDYQKLEDMYKHEKIMYN